MSLRKIFSNKLDFVQKTLKNIFWFSSGAAIGLFFSVSFILIMYQKNHENTVYTGVFVDSVDLSGMTKSSTKNYFAKKNKIIERINIEFKTSLDIATISAKQIGFGYDEDLLAEQAYSVGRSENTMSNWSIMLQAYFNQIHLSKAYRYSGDRLDALLAPLTKKLDVEPVNALFAFENGKVSAFTLAKDGQAVDMDKLKKEVYEELVKMENENLSKTSVQVSIKIIKPAISNENVNTLGIRELIAEGTSLFAHSIENRIYNIQLAAGRLNGVLIAPGEVFSFAKAVGDVSSFTGYKQAYVIENGKTILGDGGGGCQVSTTLFRAALKAGLPIVERHQHAYRVGYYEEDSGPGIDAAVYVPSVDLKFKNDTGHHVLIQTFVDLENLRLTFDLYGAKDDREIVIDNPIILSQTSAPQPLYQDDPTLPKGEVKQIDFAAGGASVYFTREVKRDGKAVINDKFASNYRPWQAVFLRGTKE